MSSVRERLLKVINGICEYSYHTKPKIEIEKVQDEHSLINDLAFDELDLVELVMGIEEEFKIEIKDDDFDKWVTVKDILSCVEEELIFQGVNQ